MSLSSNRNRTQHAGFFNRAKVQHAQRLLQTSQNPLFLTGAGISVASGVPPFRGNGGLWGTELAKFAFAETLRSRPRESWDLFEQARLRVMSCTANVAHLTIQSILRDKPRGSLFTQNVDGLHGDMAREMHGSLRRIRCTRSCGYTAAHESLELVPYSRALCPTCGSLMRHDVVLFNETLPLHDEFLTALAQCDLVIFVGTSGSVTPVSAIADAMKARHVQTVEINPARWNPSRLHVDTYICSKAEIVLPMLASPI